MKREKDTRTVNEILNDIHQSISSDDTTKFVQLNEELVNAIKADLTAEQKAMFEANQEAADKAILLERGSKGLTSAEQKFYTELIDAMKARDPKQAIANLQDIMPETIIERVFEDLRSRHPLLSKINFIPTGAVSKIVYNANGQQEAAWGELCDEIVKELTSGFKVVQSNLLKLSAFLAVCKQGITFGPAYLDRYLREVLYEAIANGMERGLVDGTGNDEPIGMTRQVGEGVTVTGGVYPRKAKVAVADFDIQTLGSLISLLASDDGGNAREVRDLILVCNQADYYAKVMPATMIMAPDGSYRSALPYNISIIPVSRGLAVGEAVLGLGYRYMATIGSDLDGNIEYSDHYRFLEDQRVYLIKAFANGFPMDNSAFLFLDISSVAPMRYLVQTVTETPSTDANLSSLSLGAAALSPAFAPSTITYTAATTNASNVVKAIPAEADAEIEVKLGNAVIPNGSPVVWAAGENVLTVKVTAANGSTNKTYTVTVTKS